MLGIAPKIDRSDLLDAGNSAVRSAGFPGVVFPLEVLRRVAIERRRGIAALLRAVVDQPVLANIKVAPAGSAPPIIRTPVGDILLKIIDPGVAALPQFLDRAVNPLLLFGQSAHLAPAIMDDADRAGESQFEGAARHHERVLRVANPAANHRVDVYVKVSVLGEKLQLFVENLQALLGNLIRRKVVNADLQVLETGLVQALDAFRSQQITIRDHSGDHAVAPDPP